MQFRKIGHSILQTNGGTPDRRYFKWDLNHIDRRVYAFGLADLPDQPNMQAAELKTYFDSSPEELRQALNRLCDALGEFSAAVNWVTPRKCGRAGADRSGRTENVQKQVRDASVGKLPSGCVDG